MGTDSSHSSTIFIYLFIYFTEYKLQYWGRFNVYGIEHSAWEKKRFISKMDLVVVPNSIQSKTQKDLEYGCFLWLHLLYVNLYN